MGATGVCEEAAATRSWNGGGAAKNLVKECVVFVPNFFFYIQLVLVGCSDYAATACVATSPTSKLISLTAKKKIGAGKNKTGVGPSHGSPPAAVLCVRAAGVRRGSARGGTEDVQDAMSPHLWGGQSTTNSKALRPNPGEHARGRRGGEGVDQGGHDSAAVVAEGSWATLEFQVPRRQGENEPTQRKNKTGKRELTRKSRVSQRGNGRINPRCKQQCLLPSCRSSVNTHGRGRVARRCVCVCVSAPTAGDDASTRSSRSSGGRCRAV